MEVAGIIKRNDLVQVRNDGGLDYSGGSREEVQRWGFTHHSSLNWCYRSPPYHPL